MAVEGSTTVRARLLTVGEAADLAGVSHLDLRRAIERGHLATVIGSRRGYELDLVSVKDLGRLYPVVLSRLHLAASFDPVDVAGTARSQAPVAAELERRLSAMRENARRLVTERDHAENERRSTLEELRRVRSSAAEAVARTRREGVAADALQERLVRVERCARGLAAIAITSSIVLVAVVVLRPTSDAAGGLDGGAPANDVVHAGPLSAHRTTPTRADYARIAPFAPAGAAPAERHEAAALESEAPAEPRQAPTTTGATLLAAPIAAGPACRYFALTRPGHDLRGILGPCLGPWNPELAATVGQHTLDGERYCAHHVFLARALGDSVTRAREVADFARQEGFAPPLLRLRVDRSAARFLKDAIGEWVESGFEDDGGGEHRITALEREGAYAIDSWVRTMDAEGWQSRRAFRMRLEVRDGEWADELLELDWPD